MDKLLLTVPEVAQLLNVGRSFAYELVLKGEIASVKMGKNRRIPVQEVDRYVQRLVEEATAQAAA